MTETRQVPAQIDVSDGRCSVTTSCSGQTSVAVIERHGSPKQARHVPIGTRDAAALSLHLDGAPVILRPGPGRYMRGSYRVIVRHGGSTYRFRPKSPDTSRLTRDGDRLGDFEVRGDGTIDVSWHDGVTPAAQDAAVGFVLAAAFGTGAQFFVMMLLDLLGHVPD